MKTKNLLPHAFFLQLLVVANSISAQPGTLDSSFGINGKVTAPAGAGSSVAIQPDGKIVVAGNSYPGYSYFKITRYNTAGTIDSIFGDNGIVTADFEGTSDRCEAVIIQQDGKIIAAGYTGDGLGFTVALARFNIDGSPDSSFGVNGKTPADATLGTGGSIYSVAIQPDEKIIVAGSWSNFNNGEAYFQLYRYNPDGTHDSAFGNYGGRAYVSLGLFAECTKVLIQPDGKIVAAGYSDELFALVRFKSNGKLDSTFGNYGIVYTNVSGTRDQINSAALQPDGKIIAGGFSLVLDGNYYRNYALARYNTNGSLDTTFGDAGKVVTVWPESEIAEIALQADGKVCAAGYHNSDFSLVRYNTDGSVDSAFGKVISDLGGTDRINSLAIQEDGKIVVAGSFYNLQNIFFAVARYKGDAVLPVTLLNFSAIKKEECVLLSWQTASEQNNNYFSVQRSSDAKNFNEIAKVKSNGNSSHIQEYNYKDITPLKGIYYYRLQQFDNDGKFTYSPVVSVYFSNSINALVYPSPTKGNITVTYNSSIAGAIQLNVFDITGKKLFTKTVQAVAGNNTYQLNLSMLAAGVYNLQINNNTEQQQARFVIEK